jgi:hypothetical protein
MSSGCPALGSGVPGGNEEPCFGAVAGVSFQQIPAIPDRRND